MASALRGYPDDADRDRELEGLLEAWTRTGCKNCCVLTFDRQSEMNCKGLVIKVAAVWRKHVPPAASAHGPEVS